MSLATRCPSCGTVFRVVSDQLKVSEGWVRCGRCTEVFNAAERLFELEPGGPTPAAPADRQAAEVHRLPVRGEAASSAAEVPMGASLAPPRAAAEPATPEATSADRDEAADESPFKSGTAASATAAVEAPPEPAPAAAVGATAESQHAEPEATATATATAEVAESAATPEFIRRADRAARWRHPSRRGPLVALALLLLALLAGQIGMHYRDALAAGWPATQPWLQAACQVVGCRIDAPRRIDSLNVDSSGLVRLPDSPLYRLSLVVQNKSSTTVRMPAVDLVLTDGQGQATVRRVFSATELGHSGASLPPRGEASLQATLDLGERRVAGYTVELFYP